MEEKNDLPVLKYLVLEVDDKLNINTEKFFEKKRKTGEQFSYEIVSPLLGHGDVTHWFKFGGFDSVLIEPNVYRASAANRIAHDISHSFRREGDLDTLFKNLYIMHSKEELINSMYSIGPDGIASIAAILRIVPTFTLEGESMVRLEHTEFYKLTRPILFADGNIRFYSEATMSKIRNSVDTTIRITKADHKIPFIGVGYTSPKVFMDIEAKNHDDLIQIFSLVLENSSVFGGYMEVYHGSKILVFSDSADQRFEFPGLGNLLSTLGPELAVHYPEYKIEFNSK